MTLNESIVEDVPFEWFRELDYAINDGPHLAPGAARATIRRFRIVRNAIRREMSS